MSAIAIVGSARGDSNTAVALQELSPVLLNEVFDLSDLKIDPYSYEVLKRADDDFLRIATAMTNAESIIFATPVYWYAMSGRMKTLLDRMTELITTRKEMGRQLKGKTCHLIACGTDPELPLGFSEPFRLTCQYFGMKLDSVQYRQFVTESS